MTGKTQTVHHTFLEPPPKNTQKEGNKRDPMMIDVAPAPRFPHPATRALAVQAILWPNIQEVQYSHLTKVPLAIILKQWIMIKYEADLMKPMHTIDKTAKHNIKLKRILALHLSQAGPSKIHTRIVEPTPATKEVQMSLLVISRSSWISGRRGVLENQTKNTIKNDRLLQWSLENRTRATSHWIV